MRLLVTGATGFIGGHLVDRLVGRGDDVHVLVRESSDIGLLDDAAVVHRTGSAGVDLTELLGRIRPDGIFHLASRFQDRHQPDDIAGLVGGNVTFGAALADAAVRAGCRWLVNTGTSWQHFRNLDNSSVCLYAATKQALEPILKYFSDANGLAVITLKLFDTYGPKDRRAKLLSTFRRIAAQAEPIDMSPGEQLLDLVHVEDVVDCFVLAGDRLAKGEVSGVEDYAVSSGTPIRLRDLAALFSRVTGCDLQINWGARAYREREVMVPWSRGQPLPGWGPRIRLEEGLRAMLA